MSPFDDCWPGVEELRSRPIVTRFNPSYDQANRSANGRIFRDATVCGGNFFEMRARTDVEPGDRVVVNADETIGRASRAQTPIGIVSQIVDDMTRRLATVCVVPPELLHAHDAHYAAQHESNMRRLRELQGLELQRLEPVLAGIRADMMIVDDPYKPPQNWRRLTRKPMTDEAEPPPNFLEHLEGTHLLEGVAMFDSGDAIDVKIDGNIYRFSLDAENDSDFERLAYSFDLVCDLAESPIDDDIIESLKSIIPPMVVTMHSRCTCPKNNPTCCDGFFAVDEASGLVVLEVGVRFNGREDYWHDNERLFFARFKRDGYTPKWLSDAMDAAER